MFVTTTVTRMSNRQVNSKLGTGRPHDRGEGGGAVDQPGVDDIQDSVSGVQVRFRPPIVIDCDSSSALRRWLVVRSQRPHPLWN